MAHACPACRHENPDDALFCNACGSTLERACASCDRSNPPEARFCNGCGAPLDAEAAAPVPRDYTPRHLADKILSQRSAIEGERKRVSVLFVDLKSSLEISGRMDPELWHRILDGFFEILAEGIHRFEGTVNQYTGDGVMALFGAPIAHEDHAQRACFAALGLRDDLRSYAREVRRDHDVGFSVRMGVHSGEVVVGKIGDDLRMDYTAQGHAVGLAARMEELASPDTCYISGDTASLVKGYFELEDLGRFSVKGLDAPVPVFQLQGLGTVKTRFDVSRARGLSRFVGRDSDMQTLEAALEQARAGNGQVIGVVAEAGTGKSRLCFEFIEQCRARGIHVPEGRGVAHGKNIPFLPILQVCRDYYGISEADSDQVAREKIAGRLLLIDEEFRDSLPLLFDFFGVPDPENPAPRMDPEARQRQLFGVLRRMFERRDRDGVGVILIEDLHWIDAGSDNFLETMWVDAVAGTPTVLLVNFRPEYRASWMQKSFYRQIPLTPLGPAAIRELLDDLLGTDPSIDGLAETIHARTGGNPFYAEEVIQSLIESGKLEGVRGSYRLIEPVETIEVPGTVQSLLASRIDRLSERDKQVLQTAAVIGKEFASPLLEEVADLPKPDLKAALEQLKQGEFVYEQSLYPVAEYAFKHPLTQEVALGSQLQSRRARIHAAVAKAASDSLAGQEEKLDENAALLAHHWEEAGEALEAASWHRRAAEWVGVNDFAAARRHWGKVRSLAASAPGEPAAALELRALACTELLSQGWRLGMPDEEAEEIYREGRGIAERLDDPLRLGELMTHRTVLHSLSGSYRAALEPAEELRALSERVRASHPAAIGWLGPIVDLEAALGDLAQARLTNQDLMDGTEHDLSMGMDLWGGSNFVWSLARRGWFRAMQGEFAESRGDLTRALELAVKLEVTEVAGWIRGLTVSCDDMRGEAGDGLSRSQEALRIAERSGSSLSISLSFQALGLSQTASGDAEAAVASLERALQVARESRTNLQNEAELVSSLALAVLASGDASRALELAREATAMAASRGARLDEAAAQLTLSSALRACDGSAADRPIEAALARASLLLAETGGEAMRPRIHEERAALARLRGDGATQESELRRALELWEEFGAPLPAEALRRQLGG